MLKDLPQSLMKKHKRQAELVRNTEPGHPLQAARLMKLRAIEIKIENIINDKKKMLIEKMAKDTL